MEAINQFKNLYRTSSSCKEPKIGFIGNGNMAKAILAGILKAKLFDPESILVSGRYFAGIKGDEKLKELKVTLARDAKEVINSCLIVFLCVKPYQLEDVAEGLLNKDNTKDPDSGKIGRKNSTLVSILAGIELKDIQAALPMFSSYMRAMPNTPLQVGAGCTAVTPVIGGDCYYNELHGTVVKELFNHLGVAEVVEESKLHAITALSGSGPAYVYLFIEALSDAGVKQGLPRDLATKFATQTLFGASKTLLENPSLSPYDLKNQVTSSGGTTIYGLHELEKYGFRNATNMCIEAATNRSKEMSKK